MQQEQTIVLLAAANRTFFYFSVFQMHNEYIYDVLEALVKIVQEPFLGEA